MEVFTVTFKSFITIVIILCVTQVNSLDSEYSEEDNELDPNDDFIPLSLKHILTDEVGAYTFSEEMKNNFVYYHSGFDDENRPIWISEVGKWDMRRMIEGGQESYEEFDRFLMNAAYRALNSTKIMSTEDMPVTQAILIADMEGFAMNQITSFQTLKYILGVVRKLLPAFQRMHAGYIVNMNYVAQTLLNSLRPIMGREFEKLEVFGGSRAKWIPQIIKTVPRDQIPEWYGGIKGFIPYQIYG